MMPDDPVAPAERPARAMQRAPSNLAIDPVRGQVVDPATVTTHRRHRGTTYHFCFRALFDARPDAYHAGRGHTPHT